MKIGILTFVHAYNYGAELQSFALQRKLRNMGLDAEVLNIYRPADPQYKHTKKSDCRFKRLLQLSSKKDLKARCHIFIASLIEKFNFYLHHKKYKIREKNFYGFHLEYTKLSDKTYYNFQELYECQLPYTHLIVGSDQVWNFMNEFSVEPFFLTFAKNIKKISYAASIGHSELPGELVPYYRKWANELDYISLREEQGAKIIRDITQRNDVVCTLDPTFLLTKDEWINSLDLHEEIEDGPYLVMYLLSRSHFSIELAKIIAAKRGLKIKLISTSAYSYNKDPEIKYYDGVSPRVFVDLFANASFAITNSFHGTSFAVNFNIPFISTSRSTKRYNSRFLTLLTNTGLKSRLIYEDQQNLTDCSAVVESNVNFDICNEYLNKARTQSLEFLSQGLNADLGV